MFETEHVIRPSLTSLNQTFWDVILRAESARIHHWGLDKLKQFMQLNYHSGLQAKGQG